jgi:hypothetical protein
MLDPIQYEFRFFQNTLSDPEPEPGAGAETSDIPAPAPAESFGSMRLRLHNTVRNPANILGGHPRGKFFSELPIPLQSCWSGRQLHFLPPNQQFTT